MSDHRSASQAEGLTQGRPADFFSPHIGALRSHKGVYWWPCSTSMQRKADSCNRSNALMRCRGGAGGVSWPLAFLNYTVVIHNCCLCTADSETDFQVILVSIWLLILTWKWRLGWYQAVSYCTSDVVPQKNCIGIILLAFPHFYY